MVAPSGPIPARVAVSHVGAPLAGRQPRRSYLDRVHDVRPAVHRIEHGVDGPRDVVRVALEDARALVWGRQPLRQRMDRGAIAAVERPALVIDVIDAVV